MPPTPPAPPLIAPAPPARGRRAVTGTPWQGDACSLVDAFRSGERHPVEELDATLAAIADNDLGAFCHVDPDRARTVATAADVSLPFGGIPTGIKELEPVQGWPHTEASLVFADRVAAHTSHHIGRLLDRGGVVPVGLTTSSEFGGLNVGTSRMHGTTHNPWRRGRTTGGSSAGSASAVAGGLVSLATGGDGGGSIRIPAGYTGLLGMKGTFGRITRAPRAHTRPDTVVLGALTRSVRDAARYLDVCAGLDPHDPSTIPSPGGWEAGLGSSDLRGLRLGIVPDLGGATLEPGVAGLVRSSAEQLAAETGMQLVDLSIDIPVLSAQWMTGNLVTLLTELEHRWPHRAGELTDEVAFGLALSRSLYSLHTAAAAEELLLRANEAMARAFDQVDLLVAATNPGPAFPAEWGASVPDSPLVSRLRRSAVAKATLRAVLLGVRAASVVAPTLPPTLLRRFGDAFPDMMTMGSLTMVSNMYGNPAVSIPAGAIDGLPVGIQVLARHHEDSLLLDVALAVERERPWPLVAPPTLSTAGYAAEPGAAPPSPSRA